jgi:hypothetical protein
MKHVLQSILVALIFFCGSSVVMGENKSSDAYMAVDQVAKLNPDTAEADAQAAIGRGDRRLLAVYGFTVEVPGATEKVPVLREKYGLRILQGTGDAIKDPRDQALNKMARQYAKKYNQIIMSQAPLS